MSSPPPINFTSMILEETIEEPSAEGVIIECHDYLCEVAKLVLFFVGTFGNILSLLVMRQQSANARSYTLTLTALTVVDSMTLFALGLDSFDFLLSKHYGSFESYIGDLGCKMYRMFPHITQMASHWLVVFVTAERFCAICFPMNPRLSKVFSLKGTKVVLSCIFGAVFASQTWRLAFDYQEPAYETETSYNETATVLVTVAAECTARNMSVYFIIDSFINQLLLLSLLPALAILTLNSATALKIARSGKNIRRIMSDASNLSGVLARERDQSEQVEPHLITFIAAAKRLTLSPSTVHMERSLSTQSHTLVHNGDSDMPLMGKRTSLSPGRPPLSAQRSLSPPQRCLTPQRSLSPQRSLRSLNTPKTLSPSPSAYNGIDHRKITECATKFRTRKSTVLLLTLTGCFLVCLTPQLAILIYLRLFHLIKGHDESFKAFIGVCRALNITSVLAAMNYADNFFIFLIAGRGFRKVIIDYFKISTNHRSPRLKVSTPTR